MESQPRGWLFFVIGVRNAKKYSKMIERLKENAYYLDYQNRRPDHLAALWQIVDWEKLVELSSKYDDEDDELEEDNYKEE